MQHTTMNTTMMYTGEAEAEVSKDVVLKPWYVTHIIQEALGKQVCITPMKTVCESVCYTG
jgi:hypothetical protein